MNPETQVIPLNQTYQTINLTKKENPDNWTTGNLKP